MTNCSGGAGEEKGEGGECSAEHLFLFSPFLLFSYDDDGELGENRREKGERHKENNRFVCSRNPAWKERREKKQVSDLFVFSPNRAKLFTAHI